MIKREFVDPHKIKIPNDYIREANPEPIEGEEEITYPILVTPKFVLVDGLRRLKKSIVDHKNKIEVQIDDSLKTDKDIIKRQLILDLQNKGLGPMERARGFQKFMSLHQVSGRKAAKMLGVTKSKIEFHLKLLELPDSIQKKIREGKIKPYSLERLVFKNRIRQGAKFENMQNAQKFTSLLNRLTSFKKYLSQTELTADQTFKLKKIINSIIEILDAKG